MDLTFEHVNMNLEILFSDAKEVSKGKTLEEAVVDHK